MCAPMLGHLDQRPAVHQRAHGPVPPGQGLHQARHRLPQPARPGPARRPGHRLAALAPAGQPVFRQRAARRDWPLALSNGGYDSGPSGITIAGRMRLTGNRWQDHRPVRWLWARAAGHSTGSQRRAEVEQMPKQTNVAAPATAADLMRPPLTSRPSVPTSHLPLAGRRSSRQGRPRARPAGRKAAGAGPRSGGAYRDSHCQCRGPSCRTRSPSPATYTTSPPAWSPRSSPRRPCTPARPAAQQSRCEHLRHRRPSEHDHTARRAPTNPAGEAWRGPVGGSPSDAAVTGRSFPGV